HVAAVKSPDLPFFEADYVHASVLLRALFGAVALNDVDVTNGRVRVIFDREGRSNLPESSGSPTGEPAALDIEHFSAPRLAVEVKDAQHDLDLAIPGLTLDISQRSGRISLDVPATLSMGQRSTRVSAFNGGAAFDGRALRLSAVQLRLD